tara:strand:- start:147 stop:686 length:540 start_codon:yes stop_codon:yes gene_type:complete
MYHKKLFIILNGLLILIFLTSCSMGKFGNARETPTAAGDRVRKNLEEGKGLVLMGGNKGDGSFQFASANPMWRATLEILDFLPLSNVDYSGGIVTTDWYNDGTASNEALKITIRFLTNEIRSDGIKIIVHKKKCGIQESCNVKKVKSALENELKVAILKKATIMEKQSKKKIKRPPKKN